ncbi:hypothetical protein JB92DRAFT_353594 [Gautieria morchelliformis]|nr:hypothetical protein JB92DRAFT_353594 [Gautieria morchelliformis]
MARVSAQLSPGVGWRPFLVILLLGNCGNTRPEERSTFLIDGAACATHFHIGSGNGSGSMVLLSRIASQELTPVSWTDYRLRRMVYRSLLSMLYLCIFSQVGC